MLREPLEEIIELEMKTTSVPVSGQQTLLNGSLVSNAMVNRVTFNQSCSETSLLAFQIRCYRKQVYLLECYS